MHSQRRVAWRKIGSNRNFAVFSTVTKEKVLKQLFSNLPYLVLTFAMTVIKCVYHYFYILSIYFEFAFEAFAYSRHIQFVKACSRYGMINLDHCLLIGFDLFEAHLLGTCVKDLLIAIRMLAAIVYANLPYRPGIVAIEFKRVTKLCSICGCRIVIFSEILFYKLQNKMKC